MAANEVFAVVPLEGRPEELGMAKIMQNLLGNDVDLDMSTICLIDLQIHEG